MAPNRTEIEDRPKMSGAVLFLRTLKKGDLIWTAAKGDTEHPDFTISNKKKGEGASQLVLLCHSFPGV
ncbi:MAG: hypothetical protein QNL68_04540 [Akkermansiaceae bacterium]